jgi:hypothetical protein
MSEAASTSSTVIPETAEGGYPGPMEYGVAGKCSRGGAPWVPALPRIKSGVGRDDGLRRRSLTKSRRATLRTKFPRMRARQTRGIGVIRDHVEPSRHHPRPSQAGACGGCPVDPQGVPPSGGFRACKARIVSCRRGCGSGLVSLAWRSSQSLLVATVRLTMGVSMSGKVDTGFPRTCGVLENREHIRIP